MSVGGVTAAVFNTSPVALPATVAVSVKTTLEPAGRSTDSSAISPTPLEGQSAPSPDGAQIQLAFVSSAGSMSVTVAPRASAVPRFRTSMS